MSETPTLLVVTGAPATGKTSLAGDLAARLRIPIISKDTLKERLYETLGSGDDLEPAIERASLAILFSVVASQLEAGVSVLAESNFDSDTDPEPFRQLCRQHDLTLIQVHCVRPTEALIDHFVERVRAGRRHPGHGDQPEDAAEVRAKVEAGVWDALDLPGELIEVDPHSAEFDQAALADRIRRLGGRGTQ